MKLGKFSLFFVFILGMMMISPKIICAQTGVNDTIVSTAIIYNGDTIEAKTLSTVLFNSHLTEAQMSDKAKYNRLRNAVYVTYPFARRAGAVMNDINQQLITVLNNGDRKKYIHTREKELKKEFTDPITNLSVYQGKVLMKLINRETGNNCYEIIREYKGDITARVYQTVAFFFNSNLKQAYNPVKEDETIEKLVKEVQRMYGLAEVRKQPLM